MIEDKEISMPIFTNDKFLRNERAKKYVEIGNNLYRGTKDLTKETYNQICEEFKNKNENAITMLVEHSIRLIIDLAAKVYAKYDIEDLISFDEAISWTLDKFNFTLKNFETLLSSYVMYSSTVSYLVYKIISRRYDILLKRYLNETCMKNEDLIWKLDHVNSENYSYADLNCEEFRKRFDKVVKKLPAIQSKSLKMKFGYDTWVELTYDQVAEKLNTSRTNIQLAVVRALRNIRKDMGPLKEFSNGTLEM